MPEWAETDAPSSETAPDPQQERLIAERIGMIEDQSEKGGVRNEQTSAEKESEASEAEERARPDLSLEERHYIRNYGKRYYTNGEVTYVIENWDEFTKTVKEIVQGVSNAIADIFQAWADSLRTNVKEEEPE